MFSEFLGQSRVVLCFLQVMTLFYFDSGSALFLSNGLLVCTPICTLYAILFFFYKCHIIISYSVALKVIYVQWSEINISTYENFYSISFKHSLKKFLYKFIVSGYILLISVYTLSLQFILQKLMPFIPFQK